MKHEARHFSDRSVASIRSAQVTVVRRTKRFVVCSEAATEWKKWVKQYGYFELRKATFLAVVGSDTLDILDTLITSSSSSTVRMEAGGCGGDSDEVDRAFCPENERRNKRLIFNRMHQEEGEIFDEFLTKAKTQANLLKRWRLEWESQNSSRRTRSNCSGSLV